MHTYCIEWLPLDSSNVVPRSTDCIHSIPAVEALYIRHSRVVAGHTDRPSQWSERINIWFARHVQCSLLKLGFQFTCLKITLLVCCSGCHENLCHFHWILVLCHSYHRNHCNISGCFLNMRLNIPCCSRRHEPSTAHSIHCYMISGVPTRKDRL